MHNICTDILNELHATTYVALPQLLYVGKPHTNVPLK